MVELGVVTPAGLAASSSELLVVLERAAARWNRHAEALGTPRIVVRVAERKSADAIQDGTNLVLLRTKKWCPTRAVDREEGCYAPQREAITRLYLSKDQRVIVEADLEVNGVNANWISAGKTDARQLEALLMHELGHVLGLDHACGLQMTRGAAAGENLRSCSTPAARASIMYPDPLEKGRPLQLEPTADALSTLGARYGGVTPHTGLGGLTLAGVVLLLIAALVAGKLVRSWRLRPLAVRTLRFDLSGGRDVLLTVASAVMCRASCPPFDLAPLAFVAWAPMLLVWRRGSFARNARFGFLQGLLVNMLAFWWLAAPLKDVAHLPWLLAVCVLLVLCCWQGLRSAVLGAGYGLVTRGADEMRPLGFAVFLAAVESLFPMVFHWGTYGFVQASPVWAQLASIGGAGLVTASLGFVNGALVMSVTQHTQRITGVATAAGGILLITLFGWWRMNVIDTQLGVAEPSRVLVVQGNLLPAALERRDPAAVYRDMTLDALTQEPRVDWVVWPETAVFFSTDSSRLPNLFRDVLLRDRARGALSPRIETPLVTGLVVKQERALFNSVVAATKDGVITGRYDKQSLVPLAETQGGPLSDSAFSAGKTTPQSSLVVNGHAVAAVICFEALDAERVRERVSDGQAQLLLNPTSDAWFAGSFGPRMHLAFSSVRAIENGRYLLRPTTTGITALIDPGGRRVWTLPAGEQAAAVAEFHWLTAATPFTRWGSFPFTLGFVGLSLTFAATAYRGSQRCAGRDVGGA